MDEHHIKIGSFICLICFSFFAFLWGCDKPPEAPQQTKTVTKKIAVAQTTKKQASVKPAITEAQKPIKKEAEKKMVAVKPNTLPDSAKVNAAVSEKKPTAPVPAKPAAGQTIGLTDLYDSQGKLDPFEPLFQPKPIALATKKQRTRSAPPTPLEKISLSQLTLVAIIRSPDENKALVEEATGKGYIVKTGMYIGLNSGKIVQILKDRIIVEEEVEDVYGKTTVSKKVLQLQKSPGE